MTPPIDIRADHLRIVQGVLHRHLPAGVKVWVFGSRASWATKDSSDLDLALDGDTKIPPRSLSALEAAFEDSDLPYAVDIVDLKRINERFRRIVEQQRVPLSAAREPQDGGQWKDVPLGDLVDIYDGPHATPRKTRSGPVFLGISNLASGRLDLTQTEYLSEADYRRWTRRVTPAPNDIVFSYETRLGEAALIPRGLRACLGRRMGLLRPRDGAIDARFLLYAFLGEGFQNTLRAKTVHGSTVDRILLTEMADFPIYAPQAVTEQRAIAHVLGTLDDKIELNRRMNATLEAMARVLFKSWFVDFDPVRAKMAGRDTGLPKEIANLFPDRLVDSKLGKMPAGWRVGHVEDGFEIVMGQSPPGHTYNDIGDGLPLFQGRSDFGFRYPKNRKFCTTPNRIAQPWDTIVSVRAPVGDINMAWECCCIGRGVAALRSKSGAVSYGYCAVQALQTHMREYEHTGTVFGAINRKQLARLPLTQPAADIVRAFEGLVRPWDQVIRLHTAEVATLTALRDTLLPRLVSGALRLRMPKRPFSSKGSVS